MALNSQSFIILAILSISLISSLASVTTNLVGAQEYQNLHIMISSINVDLEARSVSTEINVQLNLPENIYSKIECQIENFIINNVTFPYVLSLKIGRIDGGQANFTLFKKNGHYEGNVSAVFRLFGYREFYPFDSYLLNLTLTLPHFGLITQGSTFLITYWGEDYGYGGGEYNVVWEGEMAKINSPIIFYRGKGNSQATSIMPVLAITLLLLGGIALIKPERLEHRLSICLSLFIFAITYTSTMKVTGAGLTIGETIVNILLFGNGILAFVSIVERVLIEVKPRLSVIHYVLDGSILMFIARELTTSGNQFSFFTIMAKVYPWQVNYTVASLLSGFLAYFVLGPYVVKTSIFVVHSLWKRVHIGKKAKST